MEQSHPIRVVIVEANGEVGEVSMTALLEESIEAGPVPLDGYSTAGPIAVGMEVSNGARYVEAGR